MTFETISLQIDARGVAALLLEQPQRHNAMSATMLDELTRAAQQIQQDARIRAVVLAGQGGSFCAGADLNWMRRSRALAPTERLLQSGKLATLLYELNQIPQLTIAKVNGPAFGGGLGLMCVCDMAIGVESARFGFSEVKLGLVPANIAPYVVHKLGATQARRLLLNAHFFTAQDAYRYGLLDECVSVDELDACVDNEIRELLHCAPGAVAATKQLIAYVRSHRHSENRRYCTAQLTAAWEGEESAEGIQAFFERRKPRWAPGDQSG